MSRTPHETGVHMINPICLLGVAWDWLRGMLTVGVPFGGHRLHEAERLNNCVVTVLKCDRCDKYYVGWESTARSTREPYPDERREDA